MDWLEFFAAVSTGLAWPVALFAIAAMYQSELRQLIPRLTRAGPAGVEFGGDTKTQGRSVPPSSPKDLKQLPGVSRTPAVEAIEHLLHEQLQNVEEGQRLDYAVRELAQTRLYANFNWIYHQIFGSQISLLMKLNQSPAGASEEEMRQFFSQVQSQFAIEFAGWTERQYVRFLIANGLMQMAHDRYHITDIGRDFLRYLLEAALPTDRPL